MFSPQRNTAKEHEQQQHHHASHESSLYLVHNLNATLSNSRMAYSLQKQGHVAVADFFWVLGQQKVH
jgi:hypothetical protein